MRHSDKYYDPFGCGPTRMGPPTMVSADRPSGRAEYGVRLQPDARTTWSVSAELRTSILNAAGENG